MAGLDHLALELAAVSARLKAIGDGGGLTRELSKQVGEAVRPVPDAIRAGLKPRLPNRYADVLDADLSLRRSSNTTVTGMQVTLTARAGTRRIARLDRGILAHPLYGMRRHWYDQPVEPGWFTRPAEDALPQVRDAIEQALAEVKRKAEGG